MLHFQIVSCISEDDENELLSSEEDESNIPKYLIRLFGRTAYDDDKYPDKSVCVHVKDFTPFFYIELNSKFTKSHVKILIEYLKQVVYYRHKDALKDYDIINRKKFTEFTDYKDFPFLRLIFHNEEGMKEFVAGNNPKAKAIYAECVENVQLWELSKVEF